jgi:alkaline phosphatase D
METVQGGEALDRWADLSKVKTSGSLLYAPSESDAKRVYASLLDKSDTFKVYRRADVPGHLHYNSNRREGDPVIVPTRPYVIVAHDPRPSANVSLPRGNHGYDPRQMSSMKAIFYAAGPDIRAGVTVAPFENVDLYPFVAKILGLPIGPIDGSLKSLGNVVSVRSQN